MDGLVLVTKALSRSKRSMIIVAVVCFLLLIVTVYAGFIDGQFAELSTAGSVIGIIFLLLILLVEVLVVRTLIISGKTKHPLLVALENPEQDILDEIVIQTIQARGMRPTYNLHCKLKEGKAQVITNIDPKHVEDLASYLKTALPKVQISNS